MRRPWNRVDLPVYSVSSSHEGIDAMNICTWAFPSSLSPKMYTVALDSSSHTNAIVRASERLVLQFLTPTHANLIARLGKRSGPDKLAGLERSRVDTMPVLEGLRAYIVLKVESVHESGDHDLFVCSIARSKNLSEEPQLTTRMLVEEGLIL